MAAPDPDRDYEAFRQLLALWAAENPIKTSKLQVLLLTNALLLIGVQLAGGFAARNWPLYLGGALLSFVWLLSIGRTSLYQKIWQAKLRHFARTHPEDSRFQVLDVNPGESRRAGGFLRLVGGVSSQYYLIGAPLLFTLGWIVMLALV